MNDAIQAFSGNIVDEAMKDENEQIEVQYKGNHLFHTKPNNKYTGCGIHFNGQVYHWDEEQRGLGGWCHLLHPNNTAMGYTASTGHAFAASTWFQTEIQR